MKLHTGYSLRGCTWDLICDYQVREHVKTTGKTVNK